MVKCRYMCDGCGKMFWPNDLCPLDDNDDKEYCDKCWEKEQSSE